MRSSAPTMSFVGKQCSSRTHPLTYRLYMSQAILLMATRNPQANHRLDVYKTPVNNGINYQSRLASRIYSSNSICEASTCCWPKKTMTCRWAWSRFRKSHKICTLLQPPEVERPPKQQMGQVVDICQVIQVVTFLSPNVGGHDLPLISGQVNSPSQKGLGLNLTN